MAKLKPTADGGGQSATYFALTRTDVVDFKRDRHDR